MKLLRNVLLTVVAALLVVACATGAGKNLRVQAQKETDAQYMPDELAGMLSELGYRSVPIPDPDMGHDVRVSMQHGDYLMQFEHLRNGRVRIDARMRIRDNFTQLHFYEIGSNGLTDSGLALYDALRRRAELEFGRENVSD